MRGIFCILKKLPANEVTEEILTNIIEINDENISCKLDNLIFFLPEAGKTEKILTNISKMDKDTLETLLDVLYKEIQRKNEILKNVSEISDKDTLEHLYAKLNEEQMEVLRKFGLLTE